MTLKREYRLRGKKEFDKIKKEGRLVQNPFFSLLILEKQEDGPKFGFIVSKKIDKRAVVRNRIRRLLAEACRQILPKMRKDVKIAFLPKQSLKQASLDDILKSLRGNFGEFAEKK